MRAAESFQTLRGPYLPFCLSDYTQKLQFDEGPWKMWFAQLSQ